MSLTYVNGDILTPNNLDRVVFVCHQVNCKGVMGAGLAKQIKSKHPVVYKAYKEKCDSGFAHLGDVQFVSRLSMTGYIVANIFGQDGYGREKCHTDYDALRTAFITIAEGAPNDIVRIPYKMGCGLGGGDWDTVLAMIEEILVPAVDVEIWQL